MLKRFLLYGCGGWVMEVGYTGLKSALLARNPSATAQTYLWMHPIYGAAGLVLEALARRLRRVPRPVRAAVFLPLIYAAEYSTGWLLRRVLGRCPWDYGRRGLSVHGLIRLDYAPLWYAAALAFEPISEEIQRAARPRRAFSLAGLFR